MVISIMNYYNLITTNIPGQLYVAASRVGSPEDLRFAVKKPLESGSLPYLTPNVVFREILLSSEQMDEHQPSSQADTAEPIEVRDDVPQDTDYDGIYDGVPDDDVPDCDDLEDLAPSSVGHRRPRLQGDPKLKGQTYESTTGQSGEQRKLAHPRDYSPAPLAPRIGFDRPLCPYEQIREANIQVTWRFH